MTRNEAIDLIDNLIGMIEDSNGSDYNKAFRMAIEALERKRGEWIKNDNVVMGEGHVWYCSHCGKSRFYGFNEPTYNYCPNCGADMRGGNNDGR